MAHAWPVASKFSRLELSVLAPRCLFCAEETRVKDYKRRRLHLLSGPTQVVSQMNLCPDTACPGHHRLMVAEEETLLAPPWWIIGWDVFAHMGQQRLVHHRDVPEIREDLRETYDIDLSEDAVEDYLGRYQAILAARQRDPEQLKRHYESISGLILSIDGLQPEKGHETLYTVRELIGKRVWFATPLLSSSEEEVEKLFVEAKARVEMLGIPVLAWVSDKQEAFLKGIIKLFPGVSHRFCQNHFLRDLAEPILEVDSHAKVQMRKKVRGLRAIEKDILASREEKSSASEQLPDKETQVPEVGARATANKPSKTEKPQDRNEVVLTYCSAVRGILNRNQGGPLDPPGLRMAEGLKQVRASIQKNLDARQGGDAERNFERLAHCIDRGLAEVEDTLKVIPVRVETLRAVERTLNPKMGNSAGRQAAFQKLLNNLQAEAERDPTALKMAAMMERWKPGLFAGGDALDFLRDNLELERWFKLPKSHERKIHGRQHVGTRVVHEGPSLTLALDAHHSHRQPFKQEELAPYLGALPTSEELESIERRKIMRRAASRKTLGKLLGDLEEIYCPPRRRARRSGSGSHVPGG